MKKYSKTILYGLVCALVFVGGLMTLIKEDATYSVEKDAIEEDEGLRGKIAGRFLQEFEMTRDPKLNTVPTEQLIQARTLADQKRELKSADAFPVYWEERGPNNVGGRTRALLFDANDPTNKTVWAGSVSGGLWKTDDITASPPVWTKIDDLFDNLAITTIAQDPSNPNIMYFGTGESFWNIDAVKGLGIWKSEDGGQTWNVLSYTLGGNAFSWISKIVVNNNGWVYVASRSGGIWLSKDGGDTFDPVLALFIGGGVNNIADDIELASNGDIYAAFWADKIYKLPNGTTTWVPLTTGLPTSNYGRIEVASAPGNSQVLYAAFADTTSANRGKCFGVFKSTNGGNSWAAKTIPGNLGDQCWYDFILGVDPANSNRVWLGAVGCALSDDGGDNWSSVSTPHTDHHAIVYRPGSSDDMLVGSDGGIALTTNASAGSPGFTTKNDGYNVTQFYGVALNPNMGSNEMIGGTQDNATPVFSSSGIGSTSCVLCCCDGGFAHIDQDNPSIQIASTQYGSFSISNGGSGGAFNSVVSGNGDTWRFIVPSTYDSDSDVLYFSCGPDSLGRVTDAGAGNNLSFETLTSSFNGQKISALSVSPNTANRIFVGLGNGILFQIDNADVNGGVTPTNLNAPASGYLSSIAVENGDDQHILITYSNYGVTSIWETTDGGLIWDNVEGNLPDMPVRWVMFHPFDPEQALIATELGVWTCSDLTAATPDWEPTNGFGLANVRVDMLAYRSSDHLVAAATHGRGVFTTDYFTMLADCQPNLNLAGVIAPGLYTASEVITTDGTVAGAGAVILQAGEMVTMEPNFTAERGSDFWALILSCDPASSYSSHDEDAYYIIPPDETTIEEADDEKSSFKDGRRLICYPNPTQYTATIQYQLEEDAPLKVVVMNAKGQLVEMVEDGYYEAGIQHFEWDAGDLESGLYIIQVQTSRDVSTEKVFVVK